MKKPCNYYRIVKFDAGFLYTLTGKYEGNDPCILTIESDTDFEDFKQKLDQISNASIKENDKIYLSDKVLFPINIFNVPNINIKRTIKIAKADKIIVDGKSFPNSFNLYKKDTGYYIYNEQSDYCKYYFISESNLQEVNLPLETAKRLFPGEWKPAIQINRNIFENDIELVQNSTDKIISFYKLVEYTNSKLPKFTDDAKENVLSMLSSSDIQQRNLALETIVLHDLSSICIEAAFKINDKGFSEFRNNIIRKYFLNLFGCNSTKDFMYCFSRYSAEAQKGQLAQIIFNNNFVDWNQKIIFHKHLWKEALGFRYVSTIYNSPETVSNFPSLFEFFDTYNIPKIYDPESETGTDNRELEES